jgi:hypothetical protein
MLSSSSRRSSKSCPFAPPSLVLDDVVAFFSALLSICLPHSRALFRIVVLSSIVRICFLCYVSTWLSNPTENLRYCLDTSDNEIPISQNPFSRVTHFFQISTRSSNLILVMSVIDPIPSIVPVIPHPSSELETGSSLLHAAISQARNQIYLSTFNEQGMC